ncbi:MAG TPA: alpha-glucan family phosphorylase [Candidatus Eisenbacteria bacterium]|nr:alpha-glucan family phosphorylase [Candidatus Eisenbacteria bacterium]
MPSALGRLPDLARNLWWSWNLEARELFKSLDPHLWRVSRHNPVRVLQDITPEGLIEGARHQETMIRYRALLESLDRAVAGRETWWRDACADLDGKTVAFFSAEYGIHNSLPLYAGGLGVLAGDITKEASDLGIPMVAIGFMYPQGYFRQRVNAEGRQEELYQQIDRARVAVEPALGADGAPVRIHLSLPDRALHLTAWRVRIGRTQLYLLDTDLDENASWDRELTGRLYGGDQTTRLLQEIVLGIGGVRLLRALGIAPDAWHGNEGHTALMMVERVRELMDQGRSFDAAVASVRATTVFTTHTPVSAGHDSFPFPLVELHLARMEGYADTVMDGERAKLLALAANDEPWGQGFNMTVLAMRLAAQVNAVSARHGEVSRKMWAKLWPGTPEAEVPIRAITNGVHVPTWIAGDMDRLYRKHLGADWMTRHDDPDFWEGLDKVPDAPLWKTRLRMKRKLVGFIQHRARHRWADDRVESSQAIAFGALLDPEAFTIGFARRFATYKRADLIFRDPARLRKILYNRRRPVQLVFAGKAHPADEAGKAMLQAVYRAARDPEFAGRIAILEDYDMHSARWLVQGVDLWLNNPRAPFEACGTSGMKAGLNGVPNLSILDGWWVEGHGNGNGWAFGDEDGLDADHAAQDARDAEALYSLLESTIVPLYYARDASGVPTTWLRVVRRAIQTVTPRFSARRMMKEYVSTLYRGALEASVSDAKSTPPRPSSGAPRPASI